MLVLVAYVAVVIGGDHGIFGPEGPVQRRLVT